MECSICCGDLPYQLMVFCEHPADRSAEQHAACRGCVKAFVEKTPRCQAAAITSIPCFMSTESGSGAAKKISGCGALLPPAAVRSCIGPLASLAFKERDAERSERVALGGPAARRMYCTDCDQAVGVILPEDVGDGKAPCPICGKAHCTRCGNAAHPGEPCAPDEDMKAFLGKGREAKNTKRCPKCGTGVSKNGGCNHMTCPAVAGGCGHDFCWLCECGGARAERAQGGGVR
jgi:hypothetical protein